MNWDLIKRGENIKKKKEADIISANILGRKESSKQEIFNDQEWLDIVKAYQDWVKDLPPYPLNIDILLNHLEKIMDVLEIYKSNYLSNCK